MFHIQRATIAPDNQSNQRLVSNIAALFDAYRVFYEQESNLALATEFISKRLTQDESVIFYATNTSGKVLGFTQLYPSFSSVSAKRMWILNDLYVDANHRGQGVATALLNHVHTFAKETHAKGIALATAVDNAPAQRLYETLKYQKNDDFYHYFLTV